jgi:2-polyprenyl-6-methoxyphenol hydroxylase-like FAD-dependent oxidoreductase
MGDIGIVGAGTAGLQLALLLQQHGVEPTLYAERTADDVRSGRLPNTVIHNYRTRARERVLGVNHWDETALDIKGHWHYVPGAQPLSFPGYFESPSLGVDYRIYQSALLEDFENRGGRVVVGAVGVGDVGSLGAEHDLLVVCTGRGGFGDLFPPIAGRSPFTAPARRIFAGLYMGVSHDSDTHYVTLCLAGPHGEFIEAPMQTFGGNASVLLFECLPGGDFEAVANMSYADDPEAHDRAVLELVRNYNPVIYERIDTRSFASIGPKDVLQGAVTPTVRQSRAKLDDGTYAVALGDAHVTIDPVCGLGANAASSAAFALGEAILDGSAFDEQFCLSVDERRLPRVLGSFDFTNFMLKPKPHLFDVVGAMSANLQIANDFTEGFTDPERQWRNMQSAEAAAAYLGAFSGGNA